MNIANILRVARFLRITDDQDNLSLTNLALLFAMVHLLFQPSVDLASLLSFVGALSSYQVKRFLNGTPATADTDREALQEAVRALESKVSALQVGKALKPGK